MRDIIVARNCHANKPEKVVDKLHTKIIDARLV
jgi:hypothetical protein